MPTKLDTTITVLGLKGFSSTGWQFPMTDPNASIGWSPKYPDYAEESLGLGFAGLRLPPFLGQA